MFLKKESLTVSSNETDKLPAHPSERTVCLFRQQGKKERIGNKGGEDLILAGGKYFIKINFDIKIEIGMFEISNVQNFNKFLAFLILGPIWGSRW